MTDAIRLLKNMGVTCVALSEKANESIDDNSIEGPFCLVMGDEGLGVSSEVMSLATLNFASHEGKYCKLKRKCERWNSNLPASEAITSKVHPLICHFT